MFSFSKDITSKAYSIKTRIKTQNGRVAAVHRQLQRNHWEEIRTTCKLIRRKIEQFQFSLGGK